MRSFSVGSVFHTVEPRKRNHRKADLLNLVTRSAESRRFQQSRRCVFLQADVSFHMGNKCTERTKESCCGFQILKEELLEML